MWLWGKTSNLISWNLFSHQIVWSWVHQEVHMHQHLDLLHTHLQMKKAPWYVACDWNHHHTWKILWQFKIGTIIYCNHVLSICNSSPAKFFELELSVYLVQRPVSSALEIWTQKNMPKSAMNTHQHRKYKSWQIYNFYK